MWFSGKALHEWDSGDGPIHHNSWLLSLQCMEDRAFEKALGDFLFLLLCICQGLLGASFLFVGGM